MNSFPFFTASDREELLNKKAERKIVRHRIYITFHRVWCYICQRD